VSAALIVVGAGTAGMAASVFAARSGAHVMLIESSEIIGREPLSGDANVGGMTLTPALAFGRLIGERIADPARIDVQDG
jgi:flavin-dependent dehydrogenase